MRGWSLTPLAPLSILERGDFSFWERDPGRLPRGGIALGYCLLAPMGLLLFEPTGVGWFEMKRRQAVFEKYFCAWLRVVAF